MGEVARALAEVRATLPSGVKLVAVSKFHPAEAIAEAYAAGQRVFGESRAQELLLKRSILPDDIEWHFIGHLQTNKVKHLVGNVALIESVDSLHLLELIDSVSAARGIVTNILLEAHVAAEETKTGFQPAEILEYFEKRSYEKLRATHICGIMGMASNTDDELRINADFKAIAGLFNEVRRMCPDLRGFDTLSMGMSDDYPIAIANGSTAIRVGSRIFGLRST